MKRVQIRLGFSSCKFLVPDSAWVIRAGLHTGTQYDSDEETQRLDFFDH